MTMSCMHKICKDGVTCIVFAGPYAGFLKGGFDNFFGKLLIMRCNLNYTCTVKWQRNHAFRLPGPAPALLKWGGRGAGCKTRVRSDTLARVVAREARPSRGVLGHAPPENI